MVTQGRMKKTVRGIFYEWLMKVRRFYEELIPDCARLCLSNCKGLEKYRVKSFTIPSEGLKPKTLSVMLVA